MLQLFVAPTPFEGWGERAYDGTSQRQLLAVLIVSVGALALTLCVVARFVAQTFGRYPPIGVERLEIQATATDGKLRETARLAECSSFQDRCL